QLYRRMVGQGREGVPRQSRGLAEGRTAAARAVCLRYLPVPKPVMRIFRAAEAPMLSDESSDHAMSYAPMSPSAQDGFARLIAAGINDGSVVKMLFSAPGFSLAYVWFKANFPLARHSHNTDCLYYIIAGGLKLGTEALGPGDGFLLPSGTPYTYAVGPEGVE